MIWEFTPRLQSLGQALRTNRSHESDAELWSLLAPTEGFVSPELPLDVESYATENPGFRGGALLGAATIVTACSGRFGGGQSSRTGLEISVDDRGAPDWTMAVSDAGRACYLEYPKTAQLLEFAEHLQNVGTGLLGEHEEPVATGAWWAAGEVLASYLSLKQAAQEWQKGARARWGLSRSILGIVRRRGSVLPSALHSELHEYYTTVASEKQILHALSDLLSRDEIRAVPDGSGRWRYAPPDPLVDSSFAEQEGAE